MGSSSLREELFKTYLKAVPQVTSDQTNSSKEQKSSETKEERKQRAVREREQKVRTERQTVEASINQSKKVMNQEEGDLEFRCAMCTIARSPKCADMICCVVEPC